MYGSHGETHGVAGLSECHQPCALLAQEQHTHDGQVMQSTCQNGACSVQEEGHEDEEEDACGSIPCFDLLRPYPPVQLAAAAAAAAPLGGITSSLSVQDFTKSLQGIAQAHPLGGIQPARTMEQPAGKPHADRLQCLQLHTTANTEPASAMPAAARNVDPMDVIPGTESEDDDFEGGSLPTFHLLAAIAPAQNRTMAAEPNGCMAGCSGGGEQQEQRHACMSLPAPAPKPASHRTPTTVQAVQQEQFRLPQPLQSEQPLTGEIHSGKPAACARPASPVHHISESSCDGRRQDQCNMHMHTTLPDCMLQRQHLQPRPQPGQAGNHEQNLGASCQSSVPALCPNKQMPIHASESGEDDDFEPCQSMPSFDLLPRGSRQLPQSMVFKEPEQQLHTTNSAMPGKPCKQDAQTPQQVAAAPRDEAHEPPQLPHDHVQQKQRQQQHPPCEMQQHPGQDGRHIGIEDGGNDGACRHSVMPSFHVQPLPGFMRRAAAAAAAPDSHVSAAGMGSCQHVSQLPGGPGSRPVRSMRLSSAKSKAGGHLQESLPCISPPATAAARQQLQPAQQPQPPWGRPAQEESDDDFELSAVPSFSLLPAPKTETRAVPQHAAAQGLHNMAGSTGFRGGHLPGTNQHAIQGVEDHKTQQQQQHEQLQNEELKNQCWLESDRSCSHLLASSAARQLDARQAAIDTSSRIALHQTPPGQPGQGQGQQNAKQHSAPLQGAPLSDVTNTYRGTSSAWEAQAAAAFCEPQYQYSKLQPTHASKQHTQHPAGIDDDDDDIAIVRVVRTMPRGNQCAAGQRPDAGNGRLGSAACPVSIDDEDAVQKTEQQQQEEEDIEDITESPEVIEDAEEGPHRALYAASGSLRGQATMADESGASGRLQVPAASHRLLPVGSTPEGRHAHDQRGASRMSVPWGMETPFIQSTDLGQQSKQHAGSSLRKLLLESRGQQPELPSRPDSMHRLLGAPSAAAKRPAAGTSPALLHAPAQHHVTADHSGGDYARLSRLGEAHQGADAGTREEPWWSLLPDFVPVGALATGCDPRNGQRVHVLYKHQFTSESAAAHTAAAGRGKTDDCPMYEAAAACVSGGRGRGKRGCAAQGGAPKARRKSGGVESPQGSKQGHWLTAADGVKVFIDKDGTELRGRAAWNASKGISTKKQGSKKWAKKSKFRRK